jgi:aminoglycoside phosphotransferase (APT) family kinase protein
MTDVLAALHHQLHEIEPPPFLQEAPFCPGTGLVHLDLHPLNVLVGPRGPVVIDWSNAAIGDPNGDVALAYLLLTGGDAPGPRATKALLGAMRGIVARRFLSHFDLAAVADAAGRAATWKARDANMSPAEVATMHDAAARLAKRAGR